MTIFSWNVQRGVTADYLAAASWTPGGPPGSTDAATIDAGGIATSAQPLTLQNGGSLLLTGTGTSLTAQNASIGDNGAASVTVAGGAVLITDQGAAEDSLGFNASAYGTMTVDGTGSTWSTGAVLTFIGFSGTGALSVQNGGTADFSGEVFVGTQRGSSGNLTVTGAGSRLTDLAGLYVAGGNGHLTVSNGATLATSGNVDVLGDSSGGGSAVVAGPGATWIENSSSLVVGGISGNSSLTVQQGGQVSLAHALVVGSTSGIGALSIAAGGTVALTGAAQAGANLLQIATEAGGSGSVAVTGAGAVLATGANALQVGTTGAGALAVSGGGAVTAAQLAIGVTTGATGVVTVDGAGSSLAVSGLVSVGQGGSGALEIGAGASLGGTVAIGALGQAVLNNAVAAGETFAFSGASGTLDIDNLAGFHGVVSGYQNGDVLAVAGIEGATVTSTPSGGNTILNFVSGSASLGTVTLAGAYASGAVHVALADSAADVTDRLATLEAEARTGAVTGISLTDLGIATLALSASQITADKDALKLIETRTAIVVSATTEKWTGPSIRSLNLAGSGLQYVQFVDGRLTLDTTDATAQVYRMYLSAFGRVPDPGGQYTWDRFLETGTPLAAIAADFIGSAEFTARYGSSVSDSNFVTLLYQNVLGRAPDPGGLTTWLGVLAGGTPRAQVLVDFSESAEHVAQTAAAVQSGLWDLGPNAAEIARLYDTVLGRLPDTSGLAAWVNILNTGALSLPQVAAAFIASTEFQTVYGALNDTAFITALYNNTLHRAPDAGGLAAWVGQLGAGTTRANVVLDFSDSAEHQSDTAPDILNASPAQQGVLSAGPVQASAAVISAGLDTLQTETTQGVVTGITLTDAAPATIALSTTQIAADRGALHFINGNYALSLPATVGSAGAAVQAEGLGTTTSATAVKFNDGRLVFDVTDPAAEIYRLYGAALGRTPDSGGEHAWTQALQSGTALSAIAQEFLSSQEFATLYGSSTSNAAFVGLLYQNVLGRAADPAGLNGWTANLAAGEPRASVLTAFSESAEHVANTASAIHAGIWDLG